MNLYAENILDHFRHPRRKGRLPAPSATRSEVNAACGDHLTLDLRIEEGTVTNAGWTGEGCAISQAGMSMLCEEIVGMPVADAAALTPQRVRDLLGVPIGTRRLKCAFLCFHALKNALRREPQSWQETLRE